MQIGFNLPNSGPLSSVATMTKIATEGEAMGFDYLTLTDHVVLPDTAVPGYPYSESGSFYEEAPTERHEQLIGMAYIAAKTSRIRLVAAVLVVPHRPAVLAAKMLATLDVLSGGRLVVGIGAGWLKTEFDAVATTPFGERGKVTDEYIDAFRVLWTEARPRFNGRYTRFDGIVLEPKPVQRPHPPIWVGGEGPPALRRAARVGNAWYPIGSNNQHLLDSLPRLQAGIARLRKAAAEAGRGPAAVGIAYRVKRYGTVVPPLASDGERRLFSGTDDDIVRDLRDLREIGVTAIDIDFGRPDASDMLAEMRRFRTAVIEKI
ncbi:probable F420-dependent oxidoreductase, Rv2161c family [Enhydrobacter aerosaccus]|uniref:Probable F420-dependent oxidoreductase, Rv2161c family n=1 Tax=Enhydrobacter aerosaccus TaxID=225324 RepID=A0A1T4MUJ4_9HYPH|nr:LLM class F420-dependent oxidoreductase [Enhydrobacter aerosaccus]SJZ70729.1 probable F420-dependent oxidoreductase, Rv2161c family [Enhydrobacter aerosaccus]